jgi:hypothetical protein
MLETLVAMTALLLTPAATSPQQPPVSASFESTAPDRSAIQALLDTYARAVSTKDQRLFETLLLSQSIPFSSVEAAISAADRDNGTGNYPAFRKGVFEGDRFTQRFKDIHIKQDGALANVTLVFVNSREESTSWGWKTLLLLKVAGTWKIASEFYTSHK